MATVGRRAPSNAFVGAWRIIEMELWERKDIDEVEPAHIRFNANGMGKFRFLAVQGEMDCRFETREGKPFVEFTWSGFDEMDQVCGRGWAALEAGGSLQGRLFFHQGDDSGFTAERQRSANRVRRRSE